MRARAAAITCAALLATGLAPSSAAAAAAPTGIWAVPAATSVALTWEPVAGATEYRIYESGARGTTGSLVGTVPAPNTSFVRSGLTNGSQYWYTVRSWDGAVESTDVAESIAALPSANMSTGRFFVNCAATIDGRTYMYGGYGGGFVYDEIWAFDPIAGTTTITPNVLPSDRYDCGADQVDGTAYLITGGITSDSHSNQIRTHVPGSNAANTALNATMSMISPASAAYDGKVYTFGGHTGCDTFTNRIQRFTPGVGSVNLAPTLSNARAEFGIARIGAEIFVVGGTTIACFFGTPFSWTPYNVVQRFDASTETITARANLPATRFGNAVSAVNDHVYSFGGTANASSFTNNVYRYDHRANAWSTLPITLPLAGAYQTATSIRGFTYLLGGYNGSAYGNAYRMNPGSQVRGVPGATSATAPTAVTVAPDSATQVTISWAAGTGVRTYRVFRSTSAIERGSLIEEMSGLPSAPRTSVADAGLACATYWYTVTAIGWDDRETAAAQGTGAPSGCGGNTPPAQPTNTSPGNWATSTAPTLQSSGFSDVDGDGHGASQWQVRTDAGSWAAPTWDSSTTTTDLTSTVVGTVLAEGGTYWFRVRHRDDDASPAWSVWSAETSFTVDTVAPVGGSISYADGERTSAAPVTLDPGTDSGSGLALAGAVVERRTSPYVAGSCTGFTAWSSVATNPASPWTDGATAPNTCYQYRYRVPDVAGNVVVLVSASTVKVVSATIAIAVDSPTADLGTVATTIDSFATTVATVTTNASGGWQLTASDESDSWALDCACGGTIADWTGTGAAPTVWSSAVSGYAGTTVRDAPGGRLPKWGTGTGTAENDVVNNSYAALTLATPTLMHSSASPAPGGAAVTITWRLNPSASTTAGSYAATVALTATAIP